MITHFHVKNYKALRDVSLELTRMHVLIGPNDSGKTSVLEAITALCRSVDHKLGDAFVGSWEGRSLVSNLSQGNMIGLGAKLTVQGQQISYDIECVFPETGRDVIQGNERMTYEQNRLDFDIGDERWSNVHRMRHLKQRHHSDAQFNSEDLGTRSRAAETVYAALRGVQYYRFNASMLALPVAADSGRSFRMEQNGFGLALCLDNILGHDRQQFAQLESAFRTIFPQITSIKLKPRMGFKSAVDDPLLNPVMQKGDGKGVSFSFENGQEDIGAEQMSDGALLVLGYLAVLYSPEPPSVLLVEEPENGIHPHRLKNVLDILRKLVNEQGRTQVIMTTHSPYVVDLFDSTEVSVCRKTETGEVVIKRMADSPTVRDQLDVFTLGEIWASEGEEAISP